MLTKTILKEQIEKFPEEFSIDELIEKMQTYQMKTKS